MPCAAAFVAQSSAAICAAYGVDLRDPLNPMVPADDQVIVLPCASVIVIIVLLKVELTCATPDAMFLRSRRRTRVASFAIIQFLQTRPSCHALGTIDSWRRLLGRSLGGERHEQLLLNLLLLAGDRLGLAFASPRIGVGALAAHGQLAPVAKPPGAAKDHQALDVNRNLAAKIALDHVIAVDRLANLQDFRVG